MNGVLTFDYGAIVDNRLFYNYIWNAFFQLTFTKGYRYVIIDFSNVRIIKSEVLPKLCSLGILSKQNGIQIEINLNPTSDVKNFLGEIGFFDIVRQKDIFILNEGQIGDIQRNSHATKAFLCFDQDEILKKYENRFTFDERVTLSDKLKYCIEGEIFGENYLTTPGVLTIDMIKQSPLLQVLSELYDGDVFSMEQNLNCLGLDFTELIHNSLWHGKNLCFFSVQAGTYYNRKGEKFKKVDICVSDPGIGLYESLQEKFGKDKRATKILSAEKTLSLSSDKEKNIYSILAMIHYRSDDYDRGIYDIMKSLASKKRLSVNIINRCTHMYFNQKGLEQILQKNFKKDIYISQKERIDYGFSMDISF